MNEHQLRLYFAIGKYISENTREGVWGTGALKSISDALQKELPGLKGFSETNLKNMRMFYEEWRNFAPHYYLNSSDTSDESRHEEIRQTCLTNFESPSVKDFFSIGFSSHILVINQVKDFEERKFYINEADEEILKQLPPLDELKNLLKGDAV